MIPPADDGGRWQDGIPSVSQSPAAEAVLQKKAQPALGIEKNAAVIVNCKGALSVGKEDGCGKKIIKTLLKIK